MYHRTKFYYLGTDDNNDTIADGDEDCGKYSYLEEGNMMQLIRT